MKFVRTGGIAMPVVKPQDTDLICGYFIPPEGPATVLSMADLDQALQRTDGVVWLHFNLASQRARHWLGGQEWLDEFVREVLLDGNDTRTRVESVDDGLLAVLSDMHYDFQYEPTDIGTLRLFVDARRVISCRRHPLKATDRLRRALHDGTPFGGTGELLADLVEYLADTLNGVSDKLAADVDATEDAILAERYHDGRSRLGQVRRLVVQLRRHVAPQRQALGRITPAHIPWVDEDGMARLHHATGKLGDVLYDIEALQERTKVLQDELSARMAEEQNRNLFVLSWVTVVFAPGTLISGIFGMNVAGVPGVGGHDGSFWWVIAMIAISGGAMAFLLKPRR
jgi:zinc transporter